MATVIVIVLLVVIVATLIGGPAVGIGALIVVGVVLGILAAAGVGVGAWIFWSAISPWVWSMAGAIGIVFVALLIHAVFTRRPIPAPQANPLRAAGEVEAPTSSRPIVTRHQSMLSELSGLRRYAASLEHEISGAAAAQKADAEKRIAELEHLLKIAPS